MLYTSPHAVISQIRVSPSGDRIAFLETAGREGSVCVVDRQGHRFVLAGPHVTARICWSPDGREIWFDVPGPSGEGRIESVDLGGPENLLHEIEHFFVSYNAAKGKQFEPIGRGGSRKARRLVLLGRKRATATKG